MRSEALPIPEGGDVEALVAALAGIDDATEALPLAAAVIAQRLGWPVGHALAVEEGGALVSCPSWYLADPERFEPFRAVDQAVAVGEAAVPVSVRLERAARWMEDVAADASFLRRRAAAMTGIVAGAELPVVAEGVVAGVLELFTDDRTAVGDLATRLRLLELTAHTGEALAAARAARRERDREGRLRAVFDGPLAMATLDADLRIIDANAALATLLGGDPGALAGRGVGSLATAGDDLAGRLRAGLGVGATVAVGAVIGTSQGPVPVGVRAWPVAGGGPVAHVLLVDTAHARFGAPGLLDARLERRWAALEMVREIGDEVGLVPAIAEAARELLACDVAAVALSSPNGQPFATIAGAGLRPDEEALLNSFAGDPPGVFGALVVEDRPMRIADLRTDTGYVHPDLPDRRLAFLGLPLRTPHRGTIGHLVILDRTDGEPFDEIDEALAIDFAAVAARLVVHTRASRAAQMVRAQVRRLVTTNLSLLQQVRPDDILQSAVDLARSVIDAEYAALLLVEPGGVRVTTFVHAGLTPAAAARIGAPPTAHGLLRALMLGGRPLRLADLRRHPAHAGFPASHPQMTSLLGVPLTVNGSPRGLLICANHREGEFDEVDEAAAVEVAGAVERALVRAEGDTTELLDQLTVVSRRLRRQDEDHWRFLGSMSHELRSSLSGIVMSAELLADPGLGVVGTDRAPDLAARIGTVARHVMALVDNLLDLSRIQSRRLEVRLQPVDVAALLRDVLSTIAPLAADAGLTVDIPGGEDIPRVLADPLRLRQVVLNLLTNAVKFTPAGGRAWVELAIGEHDLTIAVCDTGTGIDQSNLERIFEPFERVQGTSAPGTGLGLAIARAIVELHGGRLAVSSWPGAGSRFAFTVRLARSPHLGPELEEAIDEHRANVGDDGRGRSVLLVEDDEASRESTLTVLQAAGYVVDAVGSCAEAVAALAGGAHDLVLLDAQLPDGNGLDIVPRLRELAAGRVVRVVAFSADRIGDTQERAVTSCDDFVLKPLRPRDLLRRLRALLEV